MTLNYREAGIEDIEGLHRVRMSVKENILHTPSLVTTDDYIKFLTEEGRGWLCELNEEINGFAIVDHKSKNVWALFVDPVFEHRGIGKSLHRMMLDWYFENYIETIWLSTAAGTRAERFYQKAGWKETGMLNGEVKFEMDKAMWRESNKESE
jgi:GNAT superfamily N-acetyltransferase